MSYKYPYFYTNEHKNDMEIKKFIHDYGCWPIDKADVIIVLGGDGMLLTAIREYKQTNLPIYGMNRGSVGFLMNSYFDDNLMNRLETAEITPIRPLEMHILSGNEKTKKVMAFNEVSLLRQTHQAAKLSIAVDGRVRMSELIADGLIVSTSIGSTAYNLSVNGPIIPIGNNLLAVTPISPFRPRRWKGALLPSEVTITVKNNSPHKRPFSATADNIEVRDVEALEIYESKDCEVRLLFDKGHNLEERILKEQFGEEV